MSKVRDKNKFGYLTQQGQYGEKVCQLNGVCLFESQVTISICLLKIVQQ